MTISNSYLIWVGSEHYENAEAFSAEAAALGVSKRLPSISMAKSMLSAGTVVYLAHDDGEHTDCLECEGTLECPECRKLAQEVERLNAAVDTVKKRFKDFAKEAPRGQQRYVEIREAKINALQAKIGECEICGGTMEYTGGTGGYVETNEGARMDYRTYNYWLHQPKKFDASVVTAKHRCETCGGTGTLPQGRIFGLFLPSRIEYVAKADDTAEFLTELQEAGIKIVKSIKGEAKRGCGYRKPGGVYAVTDPNKAAKQLKALEKKLGEKVELHGNFVKLLTPIEISEKRFRGIKRFELTADQSDEVEMITDALAA